MFYALYAVSVAAALAGEVYDVTMTERGLAAGVGIEKNDEFLSTDKPSARALYIRDGVFFAPFVALPLICYLLGNAPLAYGTLLGPVLGGVKHLLGGLAWKKLLKK